MDNVIANDYVFSLWWGSFLKQYTQTRLPKPVIKVLICCPEGTKRSVACAEILKYCVENQGMVVDKEICHLSQDSWRGHLSLCKQCRLHRGQIRFKEVLERAVQKT